MAAHACAQTPIDKTLKTSPEFRTPKLQNRNPNYLSATARLSDTRLLLLLVASLLEARHVCQRFARCRHLWCVHDVHSRSGDCINSDTQAHRRHVQHTKSPSLASTHVRVHKHSKTSMGWKSKNGPCREPLRSRAHRWYSMEEGGYDSTSTTGTCRSCRSNR